MAEKRIGSWVSPKWGRVNVFRAKYGGANGPTAVLLESVGEPLATLSVNMYKPECSQDSRDLPRDCFYVKQWSENREIAAEAFASGLFVLREDLPIAHSGFVSAPVWQIKENDGQTREGEAG
jgi:hypothetical protein